jgi:hypothetical protein
VNGTGADIEFVEESRMQVPTPGITDEDAIKDYTEFMTALDTLDDEPLAWLEDTSEIYEVLEAPWSETLRRKPLAP